MKWFIWKDGVKSGPYDSAAVERLLRIRQINRDTLVIPEDAPAGASWKPLKECVLSKAPQSAEHAQGNLLKFECIHCGQHLEGEAKEAGRELDCPACKGKINVPVPAQAVGRYYEVMASSGEVIRYDDLTLIRRDLLSAKINRHSKCRLVCPKLGTELAEASSVDPNEEPLDDEVKKVLHEQIETEQKRWQKDNTWRTIGDGLAVEEESILILYRPLWTSVRKWGGIFFAPPAGLALAAAAITGVIYTIMWAWA